ncbi:MAG TPA: bifunctional hydroxymethylpyrimidine kinase/phosphomethylpyrimidine kinase [Microvirga sp.]|jgi:hydroxymethylpyrimidine/phosphomethylpyrimidine kinase|nr:bifunctional hydroxymethylpyrimidine kinase/phosphomethylpyrimidine kinase [Microvirga sp.]
MTPVTLAPANANRAGATPIAVTIAGSDSGGGAGIQADLKTFSALRVYGASVVTALTAQNTIGVQGIHDVPPDFVALQIDSVFSDLAVAAVKIGMLSRPAVIEAVAAGLDRHGARTVVLDPVMVAASGDRLLASDAVEILRRVLIPRARVVTPNLPEAAAILDEAIAADEAAMAEQGRRILALGAKAVLVKGGHAEGAESADILVDAGGVRRFAAPRLATRNTHGTGCTLSAAIAAGLARGLDLHAAVAAAKAYIAAAIAASDTLAVGSGHGPVHHFHAWWGEGASDPSNSLKEAPRR